MLSYLVLSYLIRFFPMLSFFYSFILFCHHGILVVACQRFLCPNVISIAMILFNLEQYL